MAMVLVVASKLLLPMLPQLAMPTVLLPMVLVVCMPMVSVVFMVMVLVVFMAMVLVVFMPMDLTLLVSMPMVFLLPLLLPNLLLKNKSLYIFFNDNKCHVLYMTELYYAFPINFHLHLERFWSWRSGDFVVTEPKSYFGLVLHNVMSHVYKSVMSSFML